MKILFFIALLINIVFFLWELNSGGLNSPQVITGVGSYETKQILLVSELPGQDEENSLIIVENNPVSYDPVVSLALNSAINSKPEEEGEESPHQLIKSSSTSVEEFPENIISSKELLQNEQIEQNTLEHDTDILVVSDRLDSVAVSPALEEKPLTVENQEEVVVNGLLNSGDSNLEADSQVGGLPVTSVLEEKPLTVESQKEDVVNSLLNSDDSNLEAGSQVDGLPVTPVLEEKPLAVENQEEVVVNSLLNSDESNIETSGQEDSLPVTSALEEQALPEESHEQGSVNKPLNKGESNVEQAADPEINYCYQTGPFTSHNALKVWRELNKINANSVRGFNKENNVVSSYLVYFPVAETYAQSEKNVQLLKQKGITDYWLFRRGELKGAISLGLFVKKSRALSLQEKLVKAGFTIEIKERYKIDKLLYAEISTKDKVFKDTVKISDKQTISECENINDDAFVRE